MRADLGQFIRFAEIEVGRARQTPKHEVSHGEVSIGNA
jgi:hypothetical protein